MKKYKELLKTYSGLNPQIYFITLSKVVNAMGALIFPFLSLLLVRKIGMSEEEAGTFISMSSIIQGVAFFMGGKITDTFGRKKVILLFEFLAMCSFAVCIFLEPSRLMAYMIVLCGVFYGLAGPAHDAIIADLSDTDTRQAAFSLGYLGFNLGFALAQILAGFLFVNHLKLMFIIDVITTFASLVIIALFVKESIHKIDEEQTNDLEKKEEGSVFGILFKRPVLIYFSLVVIVYRLIYSQWSFMVPLHAVSNFGEEIGSPMYGFLGVFNAVIVVILTPVLTGLTKGASNIKRVIYAGILFTIGFGMLGFISFYAAFFISVLIFTLGEILEAISTMPFIMNHAPASHRGRISAVLPIIMGLGYTFGPMIMGKVVHATSYEAAWVQVGILGLFATVLMKAVEVYDKRSKSKYVKES